MPHEYSQRGLSLTAKFEGCDLIAYRDGGGVWTIGHGHTKGVKNGDICTMERAKEWLAEDVKEAVDAVNSLVHAQINQNQFDALVDFTFNLGATALRNSTLLRKLNAGDYDGAKDEFHKWNHDNGVVVDGLTRRRKAEADLFGGFPS